MVTKPSKNDLNWDVSLNAALDDLQSQVTTNGANVASNTTNIATNTADIAALKQTAISTAGPSDHGLAVWAFDPVAASGNQVLTAGTIYLNKVIVRQQVSVGNVVYTINVAGSGLTAGQNFLGLYNSSGTQVAVTGEQATNWGTAGTKTTALVGGPFTLAAGFYYVAFLSNGTTPPSFMRANGGSGSAVNYGLSASAFRFATNATGQTTLPSSLTLSSNATSAFAFWVGLV